MKVTEVLLEDIDLWPDHDVLFDSSFIAAGRR